MTHYVYDRPVPLGSHRIRLRPVPHCRSRIDDYRLETLPAPHQISWRQDVYGNYEARVDFLGLTQELRVSVDMVVHLEPGNPFDFRLDSQQHSLPFEYGAEQAAALGPYLERKPASPPLAEYLQRGGTTARGMTDHVIGLNQRLHADLIYRTRMEAGVQSPEETLALRSASCRDSGWLLVHLLRQSGLAARFASGYLLHLRTQSQLPSPDHMPDDDGVGLHAWCEVYLPEAGWIGLDPSSGLLAGNLHIPLACTPEPDTAAPIDGLVGVSDAVMAHHMSLIRL